MAAERSRSSEWSHPFTPQRIKTAAIVLDDYRHWVDEMEGLTPGYE
ncbi:MAG TPA: hypothetical protein VJ793_19795 [Anaerolineae bacterium]|nr:hypothetical protein [Anaerolineae bacterium]